MTVPENALHTLSRMTTDLLNHEHAVVYDDQGRQWRVTLDDDCGPTELLLVRSTQDGVAERVRVHVEFKEVSPVTHLVPAAPIGRAGRRACPFYREEHVAGSGVTLAEHVARCPDWHQGGAEELRPRD